MQDRKRELDALIEFSNAEIESMEDGEIADLVYNCRLFETDSGWMSFILASRDSSLDPQDFLRKKKTLLELQEYLEGKLEKIMRAMETGQQTTISEVTGTMVFAVHPAKGRFRLGLKQTGGDDTPLEREKARLDFRLMDLVRVLGLNPGRFKKCPECEHIFYQSSSKERLYCSPKCSGAHRQKEFQKKKKKGGDV